MDFSSFIGLTAGGILLLSGGVTLAHYRNGNRRLRDELQQLRSREARVHEDDSRFRVVFDMAPMGCVVWEPGFEIVDWNPQAEALFGWRREQAVGRNMVDLLVSAQDRSELMRAAVALLADGQTSHATLQHTTRQGRAIVCEWHNAVLRDDDGTPVRVVSLCVDVTERTQQQNRLRELEVQAAVREHEKRAREMFQQVSDALFILSVQDGRHITFDSLSRSAEQAFGLPAAELQGQSFADIMAGKFGPAAVTLLRPQLPHYQRCLDSGRSVDYESALSLNPTTDRARLFRVQLTPLSDEHGITRILGIGRDTTLRHQYELAQLERANLEQRLSALAANVPGLLFVMRLATDGRYHLLYVSDGVEEIRGVTADVAMVDIRVPFKRTHPDDRERLLAAAAESACTLGLLHQEYRVEHPDKGTRWVETRAKPTRLADGAVEWHGFTMDITERRLSQRRAELLNRAIDLSGDSVMLINEQLGFTYVNDAACRNLGYSRAELLQMGPSDIDPDMSREALGELVRTSPLDSNLTFQTRHRARDGHIFAVEVCACHFMYDGAKFGLSVSRDITERKRFEQALQLREQAFRNLAENSPDPIYRYDRACRRLYVNAVVGKLIGKPVQELIGTTPADGAILVSEQNQRLMVCIRGVFERGASDQIDLQFTAPDGRRRDYHMLLVPERDAEAQVQTVLALARDVSAIRETEHRLSYFLANLPGFAFNFQMSGNGRGSFPFVSAGFTELYGLQPEDVKDDMAPLHALAHPADRPGIEAAMAEAGRRKEPLTMEFRICRPGQSERWIESYARPQREADGRLLWYGFMRDITERKAHEAELEVSRGRLRELTAHRAEELEDERKRIARELHEELGQVLTALRMGLSLLRVQYGEALPALQEQSQSMIGLVDRAIGSMRQVVQSLRPIVLDSGVVTALEWLAKDFQKHTGMQCGLIANQPIELSDERATSLFRIVQEALTNAARHARATLVVVVIKGEGEQWLVSIRDNGIGFNPVTQRSQGFGLLGMKERARMLRGELEIDSRPGDGTLVRLAFPARVD